MGKKKTNENISSVDESTNSQIVTVTDGDYVLGDNEVSVSTFSFGSSSVSVPNATKSNNKVIPRSINNNLNYSDSDTDINPQFNHDLEPTFIQKVRGLTPKRDDEAFDIKRCYQFRASTIKKLNLIKCNSNDTNIYLNEVLDDAICFYYDHLFKN